MQRLPILTACIALAAFSAGVASADPGVHLANTDDGSPLSKYMPKGSPDKQWTADNGNGTYSNPLFNGEFEDPDVIRVGNDYYLASTTMHMMPAVIIMHSKDLVNWELASYCADKLDPDADTAQPGRDPYRLEGGNIYGKGIWAPCIRYHNGMFYVFCNVNGAQLQVYSSKSANGPWEHSTLPGRHDLSVLFDDDLNKIFLISGNSNPYSIDEIAPDLKSFVPGALATSLPSRKAARAHGRRPPPLQNQRQVLRHLGHPRRRGEPGRRQGRFHRWPMDRHHHGRRRVFGHFRQSPAYQSL